MAEDRVYRGGRPKLHETFDEMVARQREYFSRPEVISRLDSIPASFTYYRATGRMIPKAKP